MGKKYAILCLYSMRYVNTFTYYRVSAKIVNHEKLERYDCDVVDMLGTNNLEILAKTHSSKPCQTYASFHAILAPTCWKVFTLMLSPNTAKAA